MLRNLTIRARLILVLLFLSAELIVGALLGLGGLGQASASMEDMYANRVVCLQQLDQIMRLLNQNRYQVLAGALSDPAEIPARVADVEANIATIGEIWKAFTATALTDEEKHLADQFAAHRQRFLEEGLKPALAAMRTGDRERLTGLARGAVPATFEPLRGEANALIALQLRVAKQLYHRADADYRLVRMLAGSGLALGLLLAAIAGVTLVRAITRPLDAAIRAAEEVADGNLAHPIEVRGKDEMARLMAALQRMQAGLAAIVGQVRGGTDTIASASGQIATGNQDLSARTEAQASALEETAAALDELTGTVRRNAAHAVRADQLVQNAAGVASAGGQAVADVVRTMEGIHASASRIADIIGVIDGIAFQTNILALNAAVEAARAGEQGRGFAVVASEVRNLAQRSAAAAQEIKGLISSSVAEVDVGARQVNHAGQTIGQVVEQVREVAQLMSEIASASDGQAAGIVQVNQAVLQMDAATQQNAALVEEAAAAAAALQQQAGSLAQLVGRFRLDATSTGPARPVRALLRSTVPA
ncbi:HAMP domain-containing protein [Massilia arenosa]|uniref:HAMP domain-containing protein n=1 Tax=Zemynaea arenosa TaxID=2561931 RepID=A0A4Y9SPD8_9BURK|nr:methyl-accepting chemotaxis protein [Massilia arenosa]TFW27357.1 HAMP domain-containing protein [Massilia arenosa]